MKKIMKNLVIMLMLVSLITCNCRSSYAADMSGGDIAPMYVNTSSVNSILTINSGTATCKVINVMIKSYTSKITMTLQRSSNNSTYSDVQIWSKQYTGKGTKTLSKTKALTKGYYYRVHVLVEIYSGSTVIERITKYSTVIKY